MTTHNGNDGKQTIEQLQQRYNLLNTRRIQAETNLENAEKQLEKLKKQARKQYGTDDVEKLKAKLQQMEADNEKKRAKYQADLDQIEKNLQEVEQKYGATDAPADAKQEK
ncbi:MAG: hypothetical protein WD534_15040 [Phycisphaeraceae bacterium]